MASEPVAPQGPNDMKLSVPGATQYLQSLAHIAISICVESPHLWNCPESEGFQRDLLERLYEVWLFPLEQFFRRLQKTEEECQHGQGPLPFDLRVSSLTSLALHETHPGCQAKVLQVLAVLPLSSLLHWRDGMTSLSCQEFLEYLLTLLDLYTQRDLSEAAVVCLSKWEVLVV